jgi:haloalkane dehalogenase
MEAALFGPATDSPATGSSAAAGLDLTGITLFCQDWGGLIGLLLLAEHPERFVGCVVANTGLPTGEETPSAAFLSWQKFSQETPEFDIGVLIDMATTSDLSDQVVAGYNAPFPDDSYKAGARIFPSLVPTSPDDAAAPANKAAWDVLRQLDMPFLTAFSDQDPITGGGHKVFQKLVPGAQGQAHTTTVGGGHFLQEDCGPELAAVLVSFIAANR